MKKALVDALKVAKRKKGITFKELSKRSNGLMSEKTLERLFKGQSNMTPERYEFFERELDINRRFDKMLTGPNDIAYVLLSEIEKLSHSQKLLVLNLCREINKDA